MRTKLFLLVLGICIFSFTPIKAQETPIEVEISTKIELVNGKEFYFHTVLKKQTLYSIAKAYNVSVDDILIANPYAKDGIKKKQVLLIPFNKPKVESNITKANYIQYSVKKGETLYSIAKSFNSTVEQITLDNPEVKDGLKEGQILKIQDNNKPTTQFTEHKVIKDETLYSISKKYNVLVDDIQRNNPNISSGIKEGMILKIPISTNNKANNTVIIVKDTVKKQITNIETDTNVCNNNKSDNKKINIALLLPFYTTYFQNNDLSAADNYLTNKKPFTYLQIYEGFLLAVDSLKKAGVNANVYVYDTDEDTIKTNTILKKPEFNSMDIVIGPLFPNNVKQIAKHTSKSKIPVISPVSSEEEIIKGFSNVFQATPSTSTQLSVITNYIVNHHNGDNIIFVHNNAANLKEQILFLKDTLTSLLKLKNIQPFADKTGKMIYFKEIILNSNNLQKVNFGLDPNKTNVVISFIVGEPLVANLVRVLNEKTNKNRIVLFGLPGWRNYENIETEYFQNLNLHLFSSWFIDYEREDIKNFIRAFRSQFGTEPDRYAFLGYDLGIQFLGLYNKYGENFYNCIQNKDIKGLQFDMNFKSQGKKNGLENKNVFIYKYEDYNLKLITE